MKTIAKTFALLVGGLLCSPAFGANPARPGTLNYVEGTAYIGGNPLNDRKVGSTDLEAGQVLSTGQGKAEMLLTPGIYLRLGDNSAVKMVNPGLELTSVELQKGEAGVEVDEIYKENNVRLIDDGVQTQLLKPGFYEFDSTGMEKTYKGEAAVETGDNKYRMIKSHHEFDLASASDGKPLNKEKPVSFNANQAQDDLYNWSSLRSQYLAEANNDLAGEYGPGYAPGWYWDPWMWDYTFMGPGPFFSPFGFGYYPFGWGWGGGWGGWYGGFYGHRFYGNPRFGGIGHGGFHDGGGFAGGGFHGGGVGRGR
jgi:hypothetical protein